MSDNRILSKGSKAAMTPIQVMTAYYRDGATIGFRLKSEPDEEWWLAMPRPIWNWGLVNYKVIDLKVDIYFW